MSVPSPEARWITSWSWSSTGRDSRPSRSTVRIDGSFSPPNSFLRDAEAFGNRLDLFEKAGRVAWIAGGWLQVREMASPKTVEFQHEQLAEIFAGHRGERHAEVLGVGPRLEGKPHGTP